MSQIIVANIGSYPRIGEDKDQQRYRRAFAHLQNKDITPHGFRDVEQSVTQEIVREQIIAGVDEVTDGQAAWHDPISHLCSRISGFEIRGLTRFFDTNFYYRIPVIRSPLKRKHPLVLTEYKFAQSISSKPVRVVLTGPYTLARHAFAAIKRAQRLPARVRMLTEILGSEIRTLVEHGAKTIQIDEPSILQYPQDLPLFRKTVARLSEFFTAAGQPRARFILAFYFSPVLPLYDDIKSLPADVLQFDCTYDGKKFVDRILQSPPPVPVGFGLVNARNTRLEAIDPIIKILQQWNERCPNTPCYLTPSAGLEYLPRDVAFAKLKLLSRIRDEMSAGVQPAALTYV